MDPPSVKHHDLRRTLVASIGIMGALPTKTYDVEDETKVTCGIPSVTLLGEKRTIRRF